MILFGALAFCQMALLPGAVLLKLVCFRTGSTLHRIVYSFAASLIINFLLVRVLCLFGLYNRPVLLAIVLAEIAYLLVVAPRPALTVTLPLSPLENGGGSKALSLANLLCQTLALASVGVYAYIWCMDLGSVFTLWDDVVSWDRWAMEWYTSGPPSSGLYPQLIPANWSIAYQLLQTTDVKLFHKALMPLFPLATLLTLMDFSRFSVIGFRVACLGVFVYGVLLQYLFDVSFIVSGYVDIASAFFALLTVHAWMETNETAGLSSRLALPLVFGAATLMTKQGGIYIFALAIAWMASRLYLHVRAGHRSSVMALLLGLIVALAVSFPLVVAEWRILTGAEQSNLTLLTETLHGNRSAWQRWDRAFELLSTARGSDFRRLIPLVLTACCFSLLHPAGRRILLGVAVPLYCLWALLFSYERRTLAIALPFVALSAGAGIAITARLALESGAKFLDGLRNRPRLAKGVVVVAAGIASLVFGGWLFVPLQQGVMLSPFLRMLRNMWYSGWMGEVKWIWLASLFLVSFVLLTCMGTRRRLDFRVNPWIGAVVVFVIAGMFNAYGFSGYRIVQAQLQLQRSAGYKSLNDKLYELARRGALKDLVASEYWHLGALPELKKFYWMQSFPAGFSFEWMESLRNRNPGIRFLLFSEERWDVQTRATMLSNGYILLAVDTGFCLVAVPEAAAP